MVVYAAPESQGFCTHSAGCKDWVRTALLSLAALLCTEWPDTQRLVSLFPGTCLWMDEAMETQGLYSDLSHVGWKDGGGMGMGDGKDATSELSGSKPQKAMKTKHRPRGSTYRSTTQLKVPNN